MEMCQCQVTLSKSRLLFTHHATVQACRGDCQRTETWRASFAAPAASYHAAIRPVSGGVSVAATQLPVSHSWRQERVLLDRRQHISQLDTNIRTQDAALAPIREVRALRACAVLKY